MKLLFLRIFGMLKNKCNKYIFYVYVYIEFGFWVLGLYGCGDGTNRRIVALVVEDMRPPRLAR